MLHDFHPAILMTIRATRGDLYALACLAIGHRLRASTMQLFIAVWLVGGCGLFQALLHGRWKNRSALNQHAPAECAH